MRAFLIQTYERLKGSYWFFPALMASLAALLAVVLVQLDSVVPPAFFGSNPFFYATQPDGARSLLGAIAGSMIGVAGTVFSVTMAAVVFASSSYGPRLLTNFMNDRGNQITLGTFVATFVYSILVLRSVRDASENDALSAMFVPNLAVYGAIALAIASIGVLIFFIHHVPSNIHISNVIAEIGQSLVARIDTMFPQKVGHPPKAENHENVLWQVPDCFRLNGETADPPAYAEVRAKRSGYLQVLDHETLMNAAREHNIIIRLNCRPGTFVHPGVYIFDVWPAERLTDAADDALHSALALGSMRSPSQDLFFLIDELVEIAARALSPGVNDPFTATTCMDWLSAAYSSFVGRDQVDPLRTDGEGKLRLIAPSFDFAGYLEQGFGNLRQYAASDRIAAVHFLKALGDLLSIAERPSEIEALRDQKLKLLILSRKALTDSNLQAVEAEADAFDARDRHPRHRSDRNASSID
ncbi:DUF2254 domain-containing protein [Fulvimarina sp. MAC8]|uniref:DUF2254 domain-containing protein n=1 Tax=Fulvimarina sp. MAC8 TaxID=3162874 RepID=UPI0032ECCBC5